MKKKTYNLIICNCCVQISENDYKMLMEEATKKNETTPKTHKGTLGEFTLFKLKKKHWEYDFGLYEME